MRLSPAEATASDTTATRSDMGGSGSVCVPKNAPEAVREGDIRARIAARPEWLGTWKPWTPEWSSLYSAHARALVSFLHGRALFAGEAAHLVPIFGVRGLNSCLEDVDVHDWAPAAVVRGEAGPWLLRTVADERRDTWRQNIEQAEKSTLFMAPGTDGHRLTWDAVLQLALSRSVLPHLINRASSESPTAVASASP